MSKRLLILLLLCAVLLSGCGGDKWHITCTDSTGATVFDADVVKRIDGLGYVTNKGDLIEVPDELDGVSCTREHISK